MELINNCMFTDRRKPGLEIIYNYRNVTMYSEYRDGLEWLYMAVFSKSAGGLIDKLTVVGAFKDLESFQAAVKQTREDLYRGILTGQLYQTQQLPYRYFINYLSNNTKMVENIVIHKTMDKHDRPVWEMAGFEIPRNVNDTPLTAKRLFAAGECYLSQRVSATLEDIVSEVTTVDPRLMLMLICNIQSVFIDQQHDSVILPWVGAPYATIMAIYPQLSPGFYTMPYTAFYLIRKTLAMYLPLAPLPKPTYAPYKG